MNYQKLKYNDLIEKMTLEEKVSLLSGKDFWKTKEIERLNIPSMFLADGPHGIRKQIAASDHLGLNPGVPSTCFPTAAAIANSWDMALGEEIGQYIADEALALQVNILLGPGLNIKRSPLCGRNFEYFSEDPYLSGKMAAAYIRGIQSRGIAACPKHFAANSQEFLRMTSDSVMDERTLREIYLAGFEIAVKEGWPGAIMTSYNKLDGVYTNENEFLLRQILTEEWGFDGIVISDWGGSNDRLSGLIAGNHLEMPACGCDSEHQLAQAVKNKRLSAELLDQRVDEYLRVLFDYRLKPEAVKAIDQDAHHAAARRAAQKSIILLKNEAGILPLKAGAKTAVIGDFAAIPRYQGAGSSIVNVTCLDNTLEQMKDSGLDMLGYEPGFIRSGKKDAALLKAACRLAEQAEVILLYLGLDELGETEGIDRAHMKLAENQIEVLSALHKINPNIIVLLSCGTAVEMPWMNLCKGLLHGYLSGQAGAGAMLDVITGKVNPSGKLAETYPVCYEDTPAYSYFPGKESTAEYREGLFVGYRYYDTANIPVLLPFGFGLSYTTFAYNGLKVTAQEACFTLTNTGSTAGAEVAQLYVHKENSTLFRPYKELKGFSKVFLRPGESKTVTLPFNAMTFRYYNVSTKRFEIEGGTYTIMVGASSADLRLTATVEIKGTGAPVPYRPEALPSYYSGRIGKVSEAEFGTLLEHPIPPALWDRSSPIGRNDTFSQMKYARSPLAKLAYGILTGIKNRSEAKGKPNLNILYIYYMPFRGLGKMTGGIFNMEMTDALLEIVNGHFFRGSRHLIGAQRRKKKVSKELAKVLKNAGTLSKGGKQNA